MYANHPAGDPAAPVLLAAPGGQITGPLAQSLALGATEAMNTDTYWNAPELPPARLAAAHGQPEADERLTLRVTMGITDPPSWLAALDSLVRGERQQSHPADLALEIRASLRADTRAVQVNITDWQSAIEMRGVAEEWSANEISVALRSAAKIFVGEQVLVQRFLLLPDERIDSLVAGDLAAAVWLVNSGLRAGYTDSVHAGEFLRTIAHNAGLLYTTWAAYGASLAMATSVLLGGYPSDSFFTSAIDKVTMLLSNPQSPWRTLPFPLPDLNDSPDADPS